MVPVDHKSSETIICSLSPDSVVSREEYRLGDGCFLRLTEIDSSTLHPMLHAHCVHCNCCSPKIPHGPPSGGKVLGHFDSNTT